MKTIFSEKYSKIIRNKKQLEEELKVKIKIEGKNVSINGDADQEYIAEKVIDAINFGFPLSVALSIKNEDFLFEILNIKDYTKKKNLESVRARIIGKSGRTLRTLTNLSDCHFELKDNEVGIIGSPEQIKNAQDAVISIIQGTKQANVYAFLEKNKIKPIIDLGLKKENKRLG